MTDKPANYSEQRRRGDCDNDQFRGFVAQEPLVADIPRIRGGCEARIVPLGVSGNGTRASRAWQGSRSPVDCTETR
jgi:hypothetical protein